MIVYHRSPPEPFTTEERCSIEELVNQPEIPDLSVARATVKTRITTQLHVVDATREIYMIESGLGEVDDGTGHPTEVSAGDIVVINAGSPQKITNLGKEDLVFLCICTPRFQQQAYRTVDSK